MLLQNFSPFFFFFSYGSLSNAENPNKAKVYYIISNLHSRALLASSHSFFCLFSFLHDILLGQQASIELAIKCKCISINLNLSKKKKKQTRKNPECFKHIHLAISIALIGAKLCTRDHVQWVDYTKLAPKHSNQV